MFFNNKFNTFFGLNLTLVYTFPMCMTWRFHFPLRNYDFKHIAKQGPQIVHVRGEKIGEISIHPAALMREYLQTRGRVEATLSAYMDGTSMSREEFDLALKQLLSFAGLSNQVFKCHSVTSAVTL